MKRDVDSILLQWKDEIRRLPLLVRGARQVGKSFTISGFGERHFDNCVVVNFEQRPEYEECFSSIIPDEIIQSISILSGQEIVPGKTLLFFDEIQECPRAILSLRYFYEQLPELHVIGAGSLLEFALRQDDFRMPVGRIQYLYMKPLSFGEFLNASGEEKSRELIIRTRPDKPLNPAIHQKLISLVKKYMILGGMPAVIDEYLRSGNLNRCSRIQRVITSTYRDDFGKYAAKSKHKYLRKVFSAVPRLAGRKFKYSHVDSSLRSRELKEALELLAQAGVVTLVRRTSGAGLPLEANASDRHFKVIFLDVGLMQNICGGEEEILLSEDVTKINAGAIAEQFAGQELLAYRDPYTDPALYYWARESRNSSAEVDYLLVLNRSILPVEVKSGSTGRLKSIRLFLEHYSAPAGIRFSQLPFSSCASIVSIPLYAIENSRNLII
ncbi:MAG: ATP-binding protein [Candidatus Auribacterota bacterium]|nr:ATP-binding protein [Candidatus Auribacterota bacterium]